MGWQGLSKFKYSSNFNILCLNLENINIVMHSLHPLYLTVHFEEAACVLVCAGVLCMTALFFCLHCTITVHGVKCHVYCFSSLISVCSLCSTELNRHKSPHQLPKSGFHSNGFYSWIHLINWTNENYTARYKIMQARQGCMKTLCIEEVYVWLGSILRRMQLLNWDANKYTGLDTV